jgi:hypothetical protein
MNPSNTAPFTCCLCQKNEQGYGNNPAPLITSADARCCDDCNKVVIFTRIGMSQGLGRLNRRRWIEAIRADTADIQRIKQMF